MPKIKVSHIVSFSSEDLNFPASNLLRSENYRKWKCKDPGEKEATVLLQLEKAERIDSIDIGNECSAFAEVFVGRSSQSVNEFKVLLLTSSFMSPMESRNVTNTNRVRMFSSDKLDKISVGEKWDRVKIVCTQPFNKHIQYGLSFITLHSPSDKAETKSQTMFGGFALKDEKEDDIKAGSLFEGYKERLGLGLLKGAAAIREASNSEGMFLSKAQNETKALLKEIEKKNETKSDDVPQKKNVVERSLKNEGNPDINTATTSDRETTCSNSMDFPLRNAVEEKSKKEKLEIKEPQKRNAPSAETESSAKRTKKDSQPVPLKKCKRKSFNKLFEGVVFVLSGFQNPLRGMLRSKALQMGAKYKPDWENSCTHLICAFPNTPKYMQVLGKGHIVSKDWVEDSYSGRRRLPWRRYAMAKHEKGKVESEEEILEGDEETSSNDQQLADVHSSAERGAPSGSDTDDEIQRCMKVSVKCDKPADRRSSSRGSECYNCETEEDESEENKHSDIAENGKLHLTVPHLPDFFNDYVFYIHPQVDMQTRYELNRHVVAFKGKVAESLNEEVTHVLCEKMDDMEKFAVGKCKPKMLRLQWIWDCNDAGKVIPMEKYLVN